MRDEGVRDHKRGRSNPSYIGGLACSIFIVLYFVLYLTCGVHIVLYLTLSTLYSPQQVRLAFQRVTRPKDAAPAATPAAKEAAPAAKEEGTEERGGLKPGQWRGLGF